LDGTYHPLRAAFPNNPTLLNADTIGQDRIFKAGRGYHPPWRPVPGDSDLEILLQ